MGTWILVPCLEALRREFDQLAPQRDRASDGSIGDQAHAQQSSDHNPDETGVTPFEDGDDRNEVHAIDVDKDLTGSGVSMESRVQIIVGRHRTGQDNRLQNVIYNRRIWSRSWGWTQRAYTGSNPHDKHAHFSARYTSAAEADTRPWGILPTTPAEALTMELTDKITLTADAKEAIGTSQDSITVALAFNYLLIHSARVSRNIKWAPGPKILTEIPNAIAAVDTSADAAAAAAVAGRNAVEALTHDPADGGNTAEQNSLKAALGL